MAGTGLLRQLAEMMAKRATGEAPDLSRRSMFTLPPAPASVPSQVPQVYTPTAPTPTILDKPMTRRQVLEGAGKSALANALDVSPVGALARLATSPAAKASEAAKVVKAVVKPAYVPSPLDKDLDNSLRWTFNEGGGDATTAYPALWSLLKKELPDMDPKDIKKFDTKFKRFSRMDEDHDSYFDLQGELEDLFNEHSGRIPLNKVVDVYNASSEPGGNPDYLRSRQFIEDVMEESGNEYSNKEIKAALKRLQGE
jgi:hypothetical protein